MSEDKYMPEFDNNNTSDPLGLKNELSNNKSSKPTIAGILLILSGILSLIMWITVIFLDISILESAVDPSQFRDIDPNFTIEKLKEIITICGTIASILSVFPILGGILSIKRKMWGIAVAGSIIGLFTIGIVFISSILSFIGLILIVMSRNEFKKIS